MASLRARRTGEKGFGFPSCQPPVFVASPLLLLSRRSRRVAHRSIHGGGGLPPPPDPRPDRANCDSESGNELESHEFRPVPSVIFVSAALGHQRTHAYRHSFGNPQKATATTAAGACRAAQRTGRARPSVPGPEDPNPVRPSVADSRLGASSVLNRPRARAGYRGVGGVGAPGNQGASAMVEVGNRVRGFLHNRWLVFVAAMWMQSCAGVGYLFGSLSPGIKASLGYNQRQVAGLGVAKDLGDSVGFLAGTLCAVLPLWAALLVGAAQNLVGYGWVWLAVTRRVPVPPLWAVRSPRHASSFSYYFFSPLPCYCTFDVPYFPRYLRSAAALLGCVSRSPVLALPTPKLPYIFFCWRICLTFSCPWLLLIESCTMLL